MFNLACSFNSLVIYVPGTGSQVNFESRAQGATMAGTWTHAAATYDGQWLRLWVNGAMAAQSNFPNRLVSTTTPVYIGTNKNPTLNEPFEGVLDEVALFDRALGAGGHPEAGRRALGVRPALTKRRGWRMKRRPCPGTDWGRVMERWLPVGALLLGVVAAAGCAMPVDLPEPAAGPGAPPAAPGAPPAAPVAAAAPMKLAGDLAGWSSNLPVVVLATPAPLAAVPDADMVRR